MMKLLKEKERNSKRKSKRKKKRKIKRKRQKKRKRKQEKEKKKVAFGKGLPFFSWLQDQLWKSLLQLWTLGTNLLKWIGPSRGLYRCLGNLWKSCSLIRVASAIWFFWETTKCRQRIANFPTLRHFCFFLLAHVADLPAPKKPQRLTRTSKKLKALYRKELRKLRSLRSRLRAGSSSMGKPQI